MIATSNAGLYDVDPQNYQVKKLSSDDQPGYKTNKIKENGKFFWDITKDDNDKVYIASFSNNTGAGGRVFTYDGKATGDKWGDLLGQISPDQPPHAALPTTMAPSTSGWDKPGPKSSP